MVEDLHAEIGHPDFIGIREAKGNSQIDSGFVFQYLIVLSPGVTRRLLHFREDSFQSFIHRHLLRIKYPGSESRGSRQSIEALILIFACCFRFFAPLDAGALIILLFTEISQNTGFRAATFETLQSAIQGFIFLHVNLRHLFPSLQITNRGSRANLLVL